MAEDIYESRITRAAESIASVWHDPSAEPPVAAWLVSEWSGLLIRQTRQSDEGRVSLAEAWVELRDRLSAAVSQVVERRTDAEWGRAAAEHDERVEAAEHALNRARVAPRVGQLNAALAMRIESLAAVIDAGEPVEQLVEISSREMAIRMLLAGQGLDPEGALAGAERIARQVLLEQATALVATHAGE
ncbi:hypothetical protein [Leucobacter chromiireducens]|uniref:Uncharacterized protein n=1 Tax=Leucobacter chromiireducens subsp. solipictus TaxID=398235 RepID=A0ABS1SGI1_9MICO|nr:hypothetical protein [Leucobacter chromiireducens]MBL3679521.1 hypothetical protein [Leucobacter chromiireducens subsp. solipictus]